MNSAGKIRLAESRGRTHIDWLKSYHTFSFADFLDPQWNSFRSLRVINEDYIQPSQGFSSHPHKNMEILTYVISGSLEHKDSMGNGSVIQAGELQRMTAGEGVVHSEFNASKSNEVHLLQIWIIPAERNLPPSYEQKSVAQLTGAEELMLIASGNGNSDVMTIHQNVDLYKGSFPQGTELQYEIRDERGVWIQMIQGSLLSNNFLLKAGDGVGIENQNEIDLHANQDCEFLLFDLG